MSDMSSPRRPVCFIVVVWGREFREYFLRYCLASLMAPGNIPTLCRPGDRFLIATTREDQAVLRQSEIVRAAERYLAFEYFDLAPPASGTPAVTHSNRYLATLLEAVFRLKAYGVMLSPDVLVSGAMGRLIGKAIASGTELLMLPTIRLAEEPLFSRLPKLRREEMGTIIDLPADMLSEAAVASLHPEILAGRWDSSYFGDHINSVWWPVGNGILLHTFSFIPILIDYGRLVSHDTSSVMVSNTDGPYLADNFPQDTRVRVVQSATDAIMLSWAPYARHNSGILDRKWLLSVPVLGAKLRGALLRHRCRYYVETCNDWLKRRLFAYPVRWLVSDDERAWVAAEQKAECLLRDCLFGLVDWPAGRGPELSAPSRALMRAMTAFVPFYQKQRQALFVAGSYLAVIRAAVNGDPSARERIALRLRKIMSLGT